MSSDLLDRIAAAARHRPQPSHSKCENCSGARARASDTASFPGRISLVINSHNEGPDLLQTVLSFKTACRAELEVLILADMTTDGSTDGLPEYCRVVRNTGPEPLGCGEAKHLLVQQATGDYIHHSDGHNRVAKGTLDEMAIASEQLGAVIQPALGPLRCWPDAQAGDEVPANCYFGGKLTVKNGLPDIEQMLEGKDNPIKRPLVRTECVNNSSFGYHRDLLKRFGGWHRFPGRWGNQESAFSWRCWWTRTPIFVARDVVVLHRYQDWWDGHDAKAYLAARGMPKREGYPVPIWHRKANRRYALYVCFDSKTWMSYWQPMLAQSDPDDGRADAALAASHAEEQRREFAAIKRRSDEEWFKEFLGMDANPALTPINPDASKTMFCVSSGLGNVLMSVPAQKALAAISGGQIDLYDQELHQKDVRDLLALQPWVRKVWTKGDKEQPDWRQYNRVGVMMACRANPPRLAGASHSRAPYAHKTMHEVDCNMVVARAMGFAGVTPSSRISVPDYSGNLSADCVVVCTGVGHIQNKKYPHWETVCRALKAAGVTLVFIGRAKSSREPWMKECGLDLTELTSVVEAAGVLKHARLYLGVDNGPSHLAAAVGCPSLLLYGPTALRKNHPWGDAVHILNTDHRCAPCFETSRDSWCRKEPPDDKPCMRAINPQRVIGRALQILNRPVIESMPFREDYMSARQVLMNARLDRRFLQSDTEIDRVMELVRDAAPAVVVEIGANHGAWPAAIAKVCPPGCLFIDLDVERKSGLENAQKIVAAYGCTVQFIQGKSAEPATVEAVRQALNGRLIDVIHIDGDHSYEAVKADWQAYRPFLRPGGLALFHDVACEHDDRAGTRRFWNELTVRGVSILIKGHPAPTGNGCHFGVGAYWLPGDEAMH